MFVYVVRWTANGEKKRKEYEDINLARKAVKWLEERGIKDADIAVKPI